jgi:hypothetical protein
MKRSLLILFLFALCACQSKQQQAQKMAGDIQNMVKANSPGSIPTSATGYTMKAKIDGKDWTAVSMMPVEGIDRVIGYVGDGGYIGLGVSQRVHAGQELHIGDGNAADLYIVGGQDLLDKTKGLINITKQDGQWLEGTFSFTAASSQSSKVITVTDGVFRLPLTAAKSN